MFERVLIFARSVCIFCVLSLAAAYAYPWSPSYQDLLIERFAQKIPVLVSHPLSNYPNNDCNELFTFFPKGKVLIFGYGSLMNKQRLLLNSRVGKPIVKQEVTDTVKPAVAFGVKRIYNYFFEQTNWNTIPLHSKEKAMLNLLPSADLSSAVNGIVMEVDKEDLEKLVAREVGYDLVPVLITLWDQLVIENKDLEFFVAYAFMAANELRNHVLYTSTDYYPIKAYAADVEKGAADYGEIFLQMMRQTSYLADGTTPIFEWDGNFDRLLRISGRFKLSNNK